MKDARAGDDQTRRLYLAKGLSVPSPLQPSRQRRFFSSCITKLDKLIPRGGGGGVYFHILATRVCATRKGMVFKSFSLI